MLERRPLGEDVLADVQADARSSPSRRASSTSSLPSRRAWPGPDRGSRLDLLEADDVRAGPARSSPDLGFARPDAVDVPGRRSSSASTELQSFSSRFSRSAFAASRALRRSSPRTFGSCSRIRASAARATAGPSAAFVSAPGEDRPSEAARSCRACSFSASRSSSLRPHPLRHPRILSARAFASRAGEAGRLRRGRRRPLRHEGTPNGPRSARISFRCQRALRGSIDGVCIFRGGRR